MTGRPSSPTARSRLIPLARQGSAPGEPRFVGLLYVAPALAFPARMMAGRAAFFRQGYADALGYFTNLINDPLCPPAMLPEAYFALADTFISFGDAVPGAADRFGNYREAIGALERVTSSLRRLVARVRRLAIENRIDVTAAGEHDAADAGDDGLRRLVGIRHLHRIAAGTANGLEVVGHAAVLRHRNQGHGLSPDHMRGGTWMPIRSSTRDSCCRKYTTAAARQRRTSSRSSLRIGARW